MGHIVFACVIIVLLFWVLWGSLYYLFWEAVPGRSGPVRNGWSVRSFYRPACLSVYVSALSRVDISALNSVQGHGSFSGVWSLLLRRGFCGIQTNWLRCLWGPLYSGGAEPMSSGTARPHDLWSHPSAPCCCSPGPGSLALAMDSEALEK